MYRINGHLITLLYGNFLLRFCFFFSSRRRHTRWPRDWSSDVCSSDLIAGTERLERLIRDLGVERGAPVTEGSLESLLQQIAYETGAARRVPTAAVVEVVREVM